MKHQIEFSTPTLVGTENAFVNEAIARQELSGNGYFTQKSETFFQEFFQLPRAIVLSSCTHALEMSALLLNIQEGDEVIMPSFTFVSTANAFILFGAKPVFCDIRPDTLNIDERLIPDLITERTKAIVVVHYAGIGCNMPAIMAVAKQHNLVVIEDNAHGLFGKQNGQYLGTIGDMATHSFHGTKNITCGEGGAIFLNNPSLIDRAEIIRDKGTNRRAFLDGKVDKYTWVDVGSSYLLSEITAAYLYGQLMAWETIMSHRAKLWHCYVDELGGWAEENEVQLPPIVPASAYHIFYLIMPNISSRKQLIQFLDKHGIQATFHYQPLHSSTKGLEFANGNHDLPVTTRISNCLVRLPLHHHLSLEDVKHVSSVVRDFVSA